MGRKRCADERMDQIYKYIKEFLIEKGYPPSVREIGKAVGLKSSSTVHGYLNQLEAAGLIRRDPTKPRAIDLLEDKPWERTVNVPLIGTVTAGTPILAQENVEEVFAFPQGLLGTTSETFMLRIDGDSMINAGIFDGDYIMVRQQNTANNSDIVVALVNNETATVKRFFKEKNQFRLQPENDSMEPFYEKNVTILGKVIGVYRQM
ncbi:MAG: transcriptional repressor LexA [Anaerovibrio sp.]|uniref:transcriptional repressor LexA n=1 Tax=Anaerovibrio sp. TaxID=1872532 RepID=UPI0025C05576|nr:transcriptional repressor LexA [Anaerovibrio sp.]MBE6100314.1 transcriptional repressor LexA [Anaerovibrio sp.]